MSAPAAASSTEPPRRTYRAERAVGQGTFGTVMSARSESGERVAIKKVLQDPRFKNRELQIMRSLNHTNVTMLRDYFYTHGESHPDEVYLNVVMEFVPETLHRVCRDHTKLQRAVPLTLVRLFMFQLLRSIAYLHLPSVNVCHRDIKPHNLLVDVAAGVLKICDFGSAKQLSASEANVAYICSRYYRAPELIFGNTFYSTSIDVWSVGCIFAEMLTGEPFFKGDNSMSQLIEIIKVLGTPTKEQLNALTTRTDMRIPNIQAKPWTQIFKEHVPRSAHDLCAKLLAYVPGDRLTPFEAMCHPFFDELHDPALKLPHNGAAPPEKLFVFSEDEIKAMNPAQQAKLVKK